MLFQKRCSLPCSLTYAPCFCFSLHERPISGTGNVDLVIYAAQLSQSFFSDLAVAVEGFLDLFLVASEPKADNPKDEELDNSSMLTGAQRNVPPTALAAVVLWCDSELAKFSSAFGGTRILGNLALSPPPRRSSSSKGKNSRKGHEEYDDTARERTVRLKICSVGICVRLRKRLLTFLACIANRLRSRLQLSASTKLFSTHPITWIQLDCH